MNPIHWIMGGTAVGKKRLIRCVVENPEKYGFPAGIRAAWYTDGVTDLNAILDQLESGPLIVRWQWGREDMIRRVATELPQVNQLLYVVKVYPSVQVKRVMEREGGMKWDELALIRETQDVDLLAARLSARHRLPVRYIDATNEDYRCA